MFRPLSTREFSFRHQRCYPPFLLVLCLDDWADSGLQTSGQTPGTNMASCISFPVSATVTVSVLTTKPLSPIICSVRTEILILS
ncbi:hypothetical protein RRG08_051053 [Elysia crispata]|uniref:Uncharacterized protein n=1 Tax=Elysia crispata TaxID=231223 RepID=A0AAE1DAM9_9GAST|nr:hypothetical protein RRG08_051053 [Elysia crispata]